MNEMKRPILLGYFPGKRWKQIRSVFDAKGISPTILAENTAHGNVPCITEEKDE